MDVRRILVALLPALTLTLVLAACGGGSSSTAVPTPTFSDPPSSSAPPDPPKRESPEHFIRRWAAEDTRSQVTGETATLRSMSKGCRGCLKFADLVDQIYAKGGYVRTAGWSITRTAVHALAGGPSVDLYVHSASTTYRKSRTAPIEHLPSGDAHFQLQLHQVADSWNVTSLVQVAS